MYLRALSTCDHEANGGPEALKDGMRINIVLILVLICYDKDRLWLGFD